MFDLFQFSYYRINWNKKRLRRLNKDAKEFLKAKKMFSLLVFVMVVKLY